MVGEQLSSLIGGFAGSIASAIALPIGWAVGDALMRMPEFYQERLTETRAQESLKAMGTYSPEKWSEEQRYLSAYAAPYLDPSGQRMDTNKWLLAYQGAAREMKTEEDIRVGGHTAAALVGIVARGGENDPEEVMRQMAKLQTGTRAEKSAALRFFYSRSYIKERMIDAIMNKRDPEGRPIYARNSAGESAAEAALEKMMEYSPGEKPAFTTDAISKWLEDEATSDRVTGAQKQQVKQTRSTPWRGLGNAIVGPGPGEPTVREWAYMMAYYQAAIDERTGTRSTFLSPEEARRHADAYAKSPITDRELGRALVGPLQMDLYDKLLNVNPNNPPMTDEQMAKARAIAASWAGDPSKAPWFGGQFQDQNFWGPMDFRFTSFSGLAEQMQTMWSGVPADAMQSSADSLLDIKSNVKVMLDLMTPSANSPAPTTPAPTVGPDWVPVPPM